MICRDIPSLPSFRIRSTLKQTTEPSVESAHTARGDHITSAKGRYPLGHLNVYSFKHVYYMMIYHYNLLHTVYTYSNCMKICAFICNTIVYVHLQEVALSKWAWLQKHRLSLRQKIMWYSERNSGKSYKSASGFLTSWCVWKWFGYETIGKMMTNQKKNSKQFQKTLRNCWPNLPYSELFHDGPGSLLSAPV